MFVLRETRKIKFGQVRDYLAQYAKIEARYQALGMPSAKHYQIMGSHAIVTDREWESLAAMEEASTKLSSDPELNALRPALFELVEDGHWEFLWPV